MKFLPYGRQVIEDDDIDAVVAVLKGDYLTTGPKVAEFEAAFAEKVGAHHAVVCGNGTHALHLTALALKLGPGDAAIVPAITFMATANALRYAGAEVVFADVDPATGLMMPEQAEAALAWAKDQGWRVKAIYPVHLAGQTADPAGLSALAHRHGLEVVEDACHALGSVYGANGDRVGACTHSRMACFSFHPVKTIAMGEGGAVTTNDDDVAARMRRWRSHGIERAVDLLQQRDLARDANGTPNPWYHEMAELGYNYRATDFQCALGLTQLAKLQRFISKRRDLVAAYDQLLAPSAPVIRPLARTDCRPGWHLYVARFDFDAIGQSRAEVMQWLQAQGIGTQVHYIPVPWQPYYRARYGVVDLPGAAAYYRSCLSLPLFPAMEVADVAQVAAALSSLAAR